MLDRYLHLLTRQLFTSSFLYLDLALGRFFFFLSFNCGLPTNSGISITDFNSVPLSHGSSSLESQSFVFYKQTLSSSSCGKNEGQNVKAFRRWPCWDLILALNSPTTLTSQTTQVGIPSVYTIDKWNSQMQILKKCMPEMRHWGGWYLPEVSCQQSHPGVPDTAAGVNCPLHQHFAALNAAAARWSHCNVGEVTNLKDGRNDGDWEREMVDEEATDEEKRSETEATGCSRQWMNQIEGEVHGVSPWYSDVWAGAQRWSIVESWRQGKDSCSCWAYVGGRQTKGGKSASVFSDAGGQRVFWSWFVLVLPLSSRLQRKTEK